MCQVQIYILTPNLALHKVMENLDTNVKLTYRLIQFHAYGGDIVLVGRTPTTPVETCKRTYSTGNPTLLGMYQTWRDRDAK